MPHRKLSLSKLCIHIFLVLFSLSFIVPLWYIISTSFSTEDDLIRFGYPLFPRHFTLTAYQIVFKNPDTIVNAYEVTMFNAVVGTFLSTLVMALIAYPISRKNYSYRRFVSFFVFFTMLFGGGLVPTYILITQYLHLGNNIWVYIFPTLASAFDIIIFRTFFMSMPDALFESAKIDGASELKIFFRILLPLSKPVLATVSLLVLLGRWNDWYTPLIYIHNEHLISLQYMLQKILLEIQWMQENFDKLPINVQIEEAANLPSETVRMAIAVVAAGPVMVIFPFFQKYFTKGLVVGAIKG